MSDLSLAQRYSRAFFEASRDRNMIDEAASDMQRIGRTLEEVPGTVPFLCSPALPVAERIRIVERVFREKISAMTLHFLKLLARKGRLGLLKALPGQFQILLEQSRGVLHADVYSATPLAGDQMERLAQRLGKRLGAEVRVNGKIDGRLLAGFRIVAGNTLIDCSLKRKLGRLREELFQGAAGSVFQTEKLRHG